MKNEIPAFPCDYSTVGTDRQGLSIRDYFAGCVISAIWANSDVIKDAKSASPSVKQWLAQLAYEQADAMIVEMNK